MRASFFTSLGLPSPFAHVVFAPEALGGVLLVLGVRYPAYLALLAFVKSMLGDGVWSPVRSRPLPHRFAESAR